MKKHAPLVIHAGMFAMMITPALAASEFEGVWRVLDNAGKPYEITLSGDGSAAGTQEQGQKGTWKAEGDSVTIQWTSGWTTKIAKKDGAYVKTAMKTGDANPGAATPAEKVQAATKPDAK